MRIKGMIVAAALAVCGAGQAMAATTVFSNDFTSGLGPNESIYGVFSVGDGSVGVGQYGNNQVGAYAFTVNLQGYANPTLTYNYTVNTEPCCDFLRVYAAPSTAALFDSTMVAQYNGYQNGTASIDLAPFASQNTTVLFRFTSDGSVTGFAAKISQLSVTGTASGAGVPAPVAGAGLPLVAAAGIAWLRRRRGAAKAA